MNTGKIHQLIIPSPIGLLTLKTEQKKKSTRNIIQYIQRTGEINLQHIGNIYHLNLYSKFTSKLQQRHFTQTNFQ